MANGRSEGRLKRIGGEIANEAARQLRGFGREFKWQLGGWGHESARQLGGFGEEFRRQLFGSAPRHSRRGKK